jgi:hypothetical protein
VSPRFGLGPAALAAAILIAPPAGATEHDFQIWPGVQASLGLTDTVSANVFLQTRFGDDASELSAALVRGWLAVKPRPWLELGAGYDYLPVLEPVDVRQHLVWPQVKLLGNGSRLSVSNRTRFEARFVDGLDEVGLSLRNRTHVAHPLGDTRWYVTACEEVFFQLRDVAPALNAGFGENRVFLGLGRRFGEHVRAVGGYQLRYINAADAIQHVLMLTLFLDARLDRRSGEPAAADARERAPSPGVPETPCAP